MVRVGRASTLSLSCTDQSLIFRASPPRRAARRALIGGKVETLPPVKEHSYGMTGLLYLSNLVNPLPFKKLIVKSCKMVLLPARMYFPSTERISEADSNLLPGISTPKVQRNPPKLISKFEYFS
jgi:hypothetical protein